MGSVRLFLFEQVNPLSVNPTKWSSCLSVFGHFAGLTLKGLITSSIKKILLISFYIFLNFCHFLLHFSLEEVFLTWKTGICSFLKSLGKRFQYLTVLKSHIILNCMIYPGKYFSMNIYLLFVFLLIFLKAHFRE